LKAITDDDVDRISMCVRAVAERTPLMQKIFTSECRQSLSAMLDANKRMEDEQKDKVVTISTCCNLVQSPSYQMFFCMYFHFISLLFSLLRHMLRRLLQFKLMIQSRSCLCWPSLRVELQRYLLFIC